MAAASQIKEHMEVVGSDGKHVGTVDHLEGDDMIKLAQADSPDGEHHYLSVDFVDHIDEQVHLNLTAEEAVEEWEDEDEDEEIDLDDEGAEPLSLGDTAEDEEEESDESVGERR
jgi:hypothetical protein